ncbi:MAG: hypothetical protein COZ23_01840 [Hydrogenophilales bacterium CG_4_10_14_3_um_filter_58_23]|nr:MAG: hypothetical protein COZ23_01840 [Hydrogenophilales bacterium CG_4_10_14_3_um_filter_58_23]
MTARLDAEQQAALEKAHIKLVYFIEFHFASLVYRCSTLGVNVSWDGYEWTGFGLIGNFSPIDESQGTSAAAITFDMSLADATFVALSVGPVEEYRGRDVVMYFCPLDDNFRLVGTPKRCWRGTMDTLNGGISGKPDEATGSLQLKCETSAYGLKRYPALRLNAAQQKQRYPNDTSLDRMTRLISKQVPWLSRKFQQR